MTELHDLRRRLSRLYFHVDRSVGQRETRLFAVLGRFLPDTSIVNSRRFQHLLISKALGDTARDSIKYGALIAVAASTGSAFQTSLITVAQLVPAALLGLYAGEMADSTPKRLVLAGAYAGGAVACLVIPTLYGTDVAPMMALVFLTTAFAQLSTPAEKSVVPLIADEKQLASANSMMGIASSIGTAAGVAFLAPVLLKLLGVRAVFYFAGALFSLAATRVLHIYSRRDVQQPGFRLQTGARARVFGWLFDHMNVATMIGVSILVSVLDTTMVTLAPIYVQDVLGHDPASTVYIMGPAAAAMTASLFVFPALVRWIGERMTAALGFGVAVIALVSMGFVEYGIASLVDHINPLLLLNRIGFDFDPRLRTAMFLCMPFGLGVGVTTNSVTTYINRRVPYGYQARTFAANGVLASLITIVPLLVLSSIASIVGVSVVLILSPLIVYGVLLVLLAIERRYRGEAETPQMMVTKTFWEDTDTFVGHPSA
jgi:MFS family permease